MNNDINKCESSLVELYYLNNLHESLKLKYGNG